MSTARRNRVFKRKSMREETTHDLAAICDNSEACEIIKRYIDRGAVITAMPNGQHTPIREFHKALYREMRLPTFNGTNMYDATVPYKYQWEREQLIVVINDNGNADIIERIQLLNTHKHKTLYSNLYGDKWNE